MRAYLAAIPVVLWTIARTQGEPPADTPAVAAAKARMAAVKSLDVRFRRKDVIAQGGETRLATYPRPPTTTAPRVEVQCESICRLVFDGIKARFEDNHPYHHASGVVVPASRLFVHDGTVFKACSSTIKSRTVVLDSSRPSAELRGSFEAMPLWMVFRGHWLDRMQTSGETTMIQGVSCDEFAIKGLGASIYRGASVHIDPGRGHVPLRIQSVKANGILDTYDIQYRNSDALGWTPHSWEQKRALPDGTVLVTVKVEVVEMRINEPQDDALFDIPTPPGSIIQDNTAKKHFCVQPDGSLLESYVDGTPLTRSRQRFSLLDWGKSFYLLNQRLLDGLAILVILGILSVFAFGRIREAKAGEAPARDH